MNKLEKVQVETTWNVEFEGKDYTVMQMEDDNSGHYSWDIFDENGDDVKSKLQSQIIEFIITNQ